MVGLVLKFDFDLLKFNLGLLNMNSIFTFLVLFKSRLRKGYENEKEV